MAVLALVRGPTPGPSGRTGAAGVAGVAGIAGLNATGSGIFSIACLNTGDFEGSNGEPLLLLTVGYIDSDYFTDGGFEGPIQVLRDGVYQVMVTARAQYYPDLTPGTWGLTLTKFSAIPLVSFLGGQGINEVQTGYDTLSGQWTGELVADDVLSVVCIANGTGSGEGGAKVHFVSLEEGKGPSLQMTVNFLHDLPPLPVPQVPSLASPAMIEVLPDSPKNKIPPPVTTRDEAKETVPPPVSGQLT